MEKILFRNRLGKDFFRFMKMSLKNIDRANESILMTFAYLESTNKNLDIKQIAKIKNKKPLLFFQLVNSVFGIDSECEIENLTDKIIITIEDIVFTINKKPISNSLIQQIQAEKQNFKAGKNETDLLERLIYKMFDVDESFIKDSHYIIALTLSNEVNSFLGQLTKSQDNFDIDDEFFTTPKRDVAEPLVNMVQDGDRDSNGNNERNEKSLVGFTLKPRGFA